MKTIKIKRPKESFNKYCDYKIFADNTEVTQIGNDKEININVTDEQQVLKAKLSFCGSNKINISELDNNATINIYGNVFLNKYSPLAISVIMIFIILFQYFTDNNIIKYISLFIASCIFLILIWFLTFGRNKWLKLMRK